MTKKSGCKSQISNEPSCEIFANGKSLAIKHNYYGSNYAVVLKNAYLTRWEVEMPARDIGIIPMKGDRLIYLNPGVITLNMEFKVPVENWTEIYNENGDINIMFRQETEKLLEQAYKQIKARAKK